MNEARPRSGQEWPSKAVSIASNAFLWACTRIVLMGLSMGDLERGYYQAEHNPWSDIKEPGVEGAMLIFDQQEIGSKHTDEMAKQLLAIGGILTPLAVALRAPHSTVVTLMPIAALLIMVALCMRIFNVRMVSVPDPPRAGEAGSQAQWAKDLLDAAMVNGRSHALRVDLYRAAQRWFIIALVAAVWAGGLTASQRDALATNGAADQGRHETTWYVFDSASTPRERASQRESLVVDRTKDAPLRRGLVAAIVCVIVITLACLSMYLYSPNLTPAKAVAGALGIAITATLVIKLINFEELMGLHVDQLFSLQVVLPKVTVGSSGVGTGAGLGTTTMKPIGPFVSGTTKLVLGDGEASLVATAAALSKVMGPSVWEIQLIGSADRRALHGKAARRWGTNAALARARAMAMEDSLKRRIKGFDGVWVISERAPEWLATTHDSVEMVPDRSVGVFVHWSGASAALASQRQGTAARPTWFDIKGPSGQIRRRR